MTTNQNKITPKEAAKSAAKFFRENVGSYARITLEEVNLKEGYWYVTLAVDIGTLYEQKDYKIFKVNSETGVVESMKMRR